MRSALILVLVAAVLGGCDGLTCWETRTEGDFEYMEYIGDRRCFRLSSPRKMTGRWVRDFENSAFYEGVNDPKSIDRWEGAWFNHYELPGRGEFEVESGNIYRVELVGRTPLVSLSSLLRGSKAHNGYDRLVVVDKIIKIERIGSSRQLD